MLSIVVVVSLLLAPRRGIVWRRVRLARARRAPRLDPVLMHLYALSLQHEDDPEHGHSIQVLRTMSPPDVPVQATLEELAARSLARRVGDDLWAPTELGLREARRAWERRDEEVG
jgi:manganese/zinc/iron transport system permease protein